MPKPSYRSLRAGAPDLAYSIQCAQCQRTFISVLHPFPVGYLCSECVAVVEVDRRARLLRWLKGFHGSGRCYHGHRLTEENTYTNPQGRHSCRECKREADRRYQAGNTELRKQIAREHARVALRRQTRE